MTVKARLRRELARVPGALAVARLTVETIRVCLRYRVTGLASEAGFFMLLSLPPLLLGLFGGVGYLGQWLGQATVNRILDGVQSWAEAFLTADLIADTLLPTVQDVLETGRFDLISVGFVLSVWSGSRALNVFVDTISIMYGQSGVRGIVRTRALSLTLYFLSLLVGVVVIPLVVIGPTWVRDLLPEELELLAWLYWPTVTILAVASIATLFHISTPRRTPWWRDVPGAALTLGLWSLASFVLRGTIEASLDGTSIYGPLSAPIVLLIWLYFLAIAILIGAALNAAVRILWPVEERPSARAKAVSWIKDQVEARRGETVAGDEGLFDATVAGGAVAGGAVAGGAVPGRPAARGAGFAASGAPRVGASSGTHASRSSPVPLTPTREKPTRPRRTSRSDGGGATAQSGGKAPGQAGGNAPAQPGRNAPAQPGGKAGDADAAPEADGDAGAAGDHTGPSSGDGSVATVPATESGGAESERAKSEAAASGDGEKAGERGSSEVSPGPESGPAKETRRGLRRRRRAQFVDGDEDRLMSVRTHSAE